MSLPFGTTSEDESKIRRTWEALDIRHCAICHRGLAKAERVDVDCGLWWKSYCLEHAPKSSSKQR